MKMLLLAILILNASSALAAKPGPETGSVTLRWKIDTSRTGKISCNYGWYERPLRVNQPLTSEDDLQLRYEVTDEDLGKDIYLETIIPIKGEGAHKFIVESACAVPFLQTDSGVSLKLNEAQTSDNVVLKKLFSDFGQKFGTVKYDLFDFKAILQPKETENP